MAILKCKMCGGDLSLVAGESTAKCEYCGSVQTVPKTDDEKKLVLFERAERLRRLCEFDKAAGIYEAIVADFRQEAEAYWGLVLCKYGIEYVDDPATAKKIPTCHRSSFDSIMEDSDFEQALENADSTARMVYRKEAKQIEEIRKGIIAVSANEEPYDIFICYKETDEKGERTLDSVLAQDVYDALTDKGYRVFFSRITLEDKLGVEYEPYIFAALNSAKIMLAFGTDYEYFNAVWVKNEWGRFLKMMTKDKEKHLIPCYKGIDAYDMPKEFAKLQAQDMGKVGAMQDLLRGIAKILPLQTQPAIQETVQPSNTVMTPFLKRGQMALEREEWTRADMFFEEALNIDPECAEAYLGKLMADLHVKKQSDLKNCSQNFEDNQNYQLAIRFGSKELKEALDGYIAYIKAEQEETSRKTIEQSRKHARNLRYILISLFCAALVFSAIYLGSYFQSTETAEKDYDELVNLREDILTTAPSTQTPPTTPNENSKPPIEVPSTTQPSTQPSTQPTTPPPIPDDYDYKVLENGTAEISKYMGKGGAVTIPSDIAGYKVTQIGGDAFYFCTSLKSVTIPDSVTTIGYSAFEYCTSLTSVTIPDSVTTIGDGAFEQCASLTSVTIPDSVTEIGSDAFMFCTSLTSVTIPDSVTEIGEGAFLACYSLTLVTIPDSVTEIGDRAFQYCNKLEKVYFESQAQMENFENRFPSRAKLIVQ